MSQGRFKIAKDVIFLHKKETVPGCCRVKVAQTVLIQPHSVTLVESEIDEKESLAKAGEIPMVGMVESQSSLANTTGLVMARGLVNTERGKIPVNLVNTTDKPVKLEKGRTLGIISSVKSIIPLESNSTNYQNSERMFTIEDIPEHVRPVLSQSADLSPEEISKIVQLIHDYPNVFAEPDGSLGQTDLVKHTIETGKADPIKQPVRRLPWSKQDTVDREVDKMLKQGVIEESDSPWASPVVLVTKKDGLFDFVLIIVN